MGIDKENRTGTARRALASAAVLATSVAAVLAAATGNAQAAPSGPSGAPLTISNGTATLKVGSGTIALPGTATEAAWSPDGSRLAYIDADGDVVNADDSGNDRIVLTKTDASVTRSRPTWEDGGAEIIFAEKAAGGVSRLMSVDANGLTLGQPTAEEPVPEISGDKTDDTSPDAMYADTGVGPFGGESKLVYQHQGTAGPEVWILDRNTRGPAGSKLLAGAQPSISPDGGKVAFVDGATGRIETVTIPVNGTPVVANVTPATTDKYSHLTWSPDGTTIAFSNDGKDVETVPAAGGTPTVASATPGVPGYRPHNPHHVDRIEGADRIGTSIAASQALYRTRDLNSDTRPAYAQTVVLSRSDQFADALAGTPLARNNNGPLLLTPTGGLAPAVAAEMQRVLGTPSQTYHPTVYLLGGTGALSPAVASQVAALGYVPVRLGGADRYATAVQIADAQTVYNGARHTPDRILIATGMNYPDALSAGAASGYDSVILLTDGTSMPAATQIWLENYTLGATVSGNKVATYAIGGQANTALQSIGFTSGQQYTDVHGADRYLTSLAVAKTFFDGPAHVGFATGLNWPDSLPGGALMSQLRGPLLLVDPKQGPDADATTWLRETGPQLTTAVIFGGPGAVAPSIDGVVGDDISAVGYDTAVNPTTGL